MENDFQFQLIDGEFTPAGAAKVLFPLINNKINSFVTIKIIPIFGYISK